MSSDSVAGYFDCRVPPIDPLAGQLENFCRLKFTSDEDVIGLYIGSTADDMLNVGTLPEYRVQLSPDRPVIVGRAIGNFVPYLDPAYTSNSLVPGTGQNILAAGNLEKDGLVSRAHFMLRATAGGVMLVNGVPMVGGGLRPPRNGTKLISPENREMGPGEELWIENGSDAVILLPNETEVRIVAG